MKVAVTARAAPIVTTQEPVPAQAPPQPVKPDPAAGAAVRVTTVPGVVGLAALVAAARRRAGEEVTVPPPMPAVVTVSAEDTIGGEGRGNARAALMVTRQEPRARAGAAQLVKRRAVAAARGEGHDGPRGVGLAALGAAAPHLPGRRSTVPPPMPAVATVSAGHGRG